MNSIWQPAVVILVVAVAVGLRFSSKFRGYQFTAWIIAAVVCAMIYPTAFLKWGEFDLRNKWAILLVVQLVMFGMGTQMSLKDFAGIAKTPWAVLVGVIGQFTIMPLVGFALTKVFPFEPEIAAGVILIGSCSAGLASNVMAYLAGANLALSITLTAITTLLAPVMTPLWMKLLAGQLVEVKFFNLMMEIIKIVIVPLCAALLHDYLKHAPASSRRIVYGIAAAGAVWLAFLALGGWNMATTNAGGVATTVIGIPGFLLGAVIVGVVYHGLTLHCPGLNRRVPLMSMAGIVYFTTVTTAAGRDHLLAIGGLLLLASAIHNAAGYFLGYWLSRACGMDRWSARSVAFEVGMQNGGMASGLAGAMGKLGTVGLASAIFSPWMNISASVLANHWRKQPVRPAEATATAA